MSDLEVARATAMWMRYAQEDLSAARAGLEDRVRIAPRHVCFAAQQAAEKALKARYVAREVQYPFVHDLIDLAAGLDPDREAVAKDDLVWLSEWAKRHRYPTGEDADWDDAERAVRLATEVVEAASEELT